MRDIDFLNIMMARAKLVGSVVAHEQDGWKFKIYVDNGSSCFANFDEAMAYIGRMIPENNRIMERLYEGAE